MNNGSFTSHEIMRHLDSRLDDLRTYVGNQVAQLAARLDRIPDLEKTAEGERVRVEFLHREVAALESRVSELERAQPQNTMTSTAIKWIAVTILSTLAASYGGTLFTNNGASNGREGRSTEPATRDGR